MLLGRAAGAPPRRSRTTGRWSTPWPARLADARERLESRAPQAARRRRRDLDAALRDGRERRRASRPSWRSSPGTSTTLRGAAGQGARATSTRPPAARSWSPRPTCSARPASTTVAAGLPATASSTRDQPRRAHAVGGRHLRGRHGRRPRRHLDLRPPHRRRLLLRRVPRAARATSPRGCTPSAARRAQAVVGEPYRPMILVCAHAGLKTGEDGPTHADPQALQLLQENFPPGTMITLTPWEPQEIWPLWPRRWRAPGGHRALRHPAQRDGPRPRGAGAGAGRRRRRQGVYLLRARRRARGDGTVVLQESGVAYAFVERPCRCSSRTGIDLDVYYVASAELFDLLPAAEREPDLPRGARAGGHGHHRLHPADDVPLGPLRAGPRRHAAPLPEGPLPRAAGRARWCWPRRASTARASTRRSSATSRVDPASHRTTAPATRPGPPFTPGPLPWSCSLSGPVGVQPSLGSVLLRSPTS